MKQHLTDQSLTTFNWFRLALSLNGSVIPKIWLRVTMSALFALLIVLIDTQTQLNVQVPILASVIPNVVIGLLLVFRTNTAYDRFWEGRRMWGSVTNTTRSLARQIITHTQTSDQPRLLDLVKQFPFALMNHLRESSTQHIPYQITVTLEKEISSLKLEPMIQSNIQLLINELTNYFGGCERILKTPMPLAYGIHLKQLLVIYSLTLPFQFVGELSWYSILIVGIVSFTLFGIEEIGLEIENPFGTDKNDLPLETMCQTITNNIEDIHKICN
jgi:ion channel-forming bestrophin family protein